MLSSTSTHFFILNIHFLNKFLLQIKYLNHNYEFGEAASRPATFFPPSSRLSIFHIHFVLKLFAIPYCSFGNCGCLPGTVPPFPMLPAFPISGYFSFWTSLLSLTFKPGVCFALIRLQNYCVRSTHVNDHKLPWWSDAYSTQE